MHKLSYSLRLPDFQTLTGHIQQIKNKGLVSYHKATFDWLANEVAKAV